MKSRKKVNFNEIDKELINGQSVDLLRELHLLTPEGHLNADARRKLKQVNHLIQFVRPCIEKIKAQGLPLNIVDLGSGKSYLGFAIYDLFCRDYPASKIVSVETRPELINKSRELAKRLGFDRMEFVQKSIQDFEYIEVPDLVLGLHACDKATDYAIIGALKKEAKNLMLVPCCQAEVSEQLSQIRNENWGSIWRHGIHRREFGSQITNVIRSLVLESAGYKVSVTELVGLEHSLKNELILAQKIQKSNPAAKKTLDQLLSELPVNPTCLQALK